MALKAPISGLMSLSIKHVIVVRGVYTYKRRIPLTLHSLLGSKPVQRSLNTRDPREAAIAAARMNIELEAFWASLGNSPEGLTLEQTRDAARARLSSLGLKPGEARTNPEALWALLDAFEKEHGHAFMEARHHEGKAAEERFLTPVNQETARLLAEGEAPRAVTWSDARARYLEHHDKGNDEAWARDLTPAYEAVVFAVGDLPLEAYARAHAHAVRDRLYEGQPKADGSSKRLSSGTVRRRLTIINAIFNKAKREHGLTCPNPFEGLSLPREGRDAKAAVVLSPEQLGAIAAACRKLDDQRRHIISMQSDTGARLEEIVGLRAGDVHLAHEVPHIVIRADEASGRTLKTSASARKVPLVGEALWGAQRAMSALGTKATPGTWVFPAYASDTQIKSDSASAAIIKWLNGLSGIAGANTRSFRHAMKDRLRAVEVPKVVQDRILGHSSGGVGERYGEGHPLALLREHLSKVVLPAPPVGSS